jgi:hypothetical protein
MLGQVSIKTYMTGIDFTGVLRTKDVSPYIYFIKRGYLLYIGETQKNPVIRWSEHLGEKGSFRNAANRVDEEIIVGNFKTFFFAYECNLLETDLAEVERRRATQHIEHEVHSLIMCNGLPERGIRLISNTIRTAPLGYNYEWLSSYVKDIYQLFVNDLISVMVLEPLVPDSRE